VVKIVKIGFVVGEILCFEKRPLSISAIFHHKLLIINYLWINIGTVQQFRIWIFLTDENADFADLTLIFIYFM
jgi:hypothetical protein